MKWFAPNKRLTVIYTAMIETFSRERIYFLLHFMEWDWGVYTQHTAVPQVSLQLFSSSASSPLVLSWTGPYTQISQQLDYLNTAELSFQILFHLGHKRINISKSWIRNKLCLLMSRQTLQPLPSHISPPHVLLLAWKQLWMQSFNLLNNLHLYLSGKTCTADVDRQNRPLSRILQGNWNQKHVNQTAACIILLWNAEKFERPDYEVWWERTVHALALVSDRDCHQTLEVRLVTTKCFFTDLGWEGAAHNSVHFPLS